ncbi:hypothetical protein KKJ06_22430 [Xenorhabdus bovienii]|uniref:hypothetical protein n=1 Tax=Xenorhabdus bovienii TaxID=40576 RepID=UPI00237D0420|nr:hypothetical protein [Xenorhabdus bovienii]MDE1483414.1 hypothetical protein [Xenorhabdus bovienii]MDE9434023.1 hypothetical protein [Xenorhabdus bovienii]MDE9442495.1 hypothetical protein [Xenorhabdus bovienii]MDE9491649.1 hypothetical protein [Xenorhabdus bovienii]MDE9493336.1 hypothetical protein [Xenorhabdus bovienii]
MKFIVKNISYLSSYMPAEDIEVELKIFTDENSRNFFTAWVEFPYSDNLSLGEIKEKAVEIAKEKLKKASGQI